MLSDREREVLRLVARGRTNAEIGADLYITEGTVKTHLALAYTKPDVTDRTSAYWERCNGASWDPGM